MAPPAKLHEIAHKLQSQAGARGAKGVGGKAPAPSKSEKMILESLESAEKVQAIQKDLALLEERRLRAQVIQERAMRRIALLESKAAKDVKANSATRTQINKDLHQEEESLKKINEHHRKIADNQRRAGQSAASARRAEEGSDDDDTPKDKTYFEKAKGVVKGWLGQTTDQFKQASQFAARNQLYRGAAPGSGWKASEDVAKETLGFRRGQIHSREQGAYFGYDQNEADQALSEVNKVARFETDKDGTAGDKTGQMAANAMLYARVMNMDVSRAIEIATKHQFKYGQSVNQTHDSFMDIQKTMAATNAAAGHDFLWADDFSRDIMEASMNSNLLSINLGAVAAVSARVAANAEKAGASYDTYTKAAKSVTDLTLNPEDWIRVPAAQEALKALIGFKDSNELAAAVKKLYSDTDDKTRELIAKKVKDIQSGAIGEYSGTNQLMDLVGGLKQGKKYVLDQWKNVIDSTNGEAAAFFVSQGYTKSSTEAQAMADSMQQGSALLKEDPNKTAEGSDENVADPSSGAAALSMWAMGPENYVELVKKQQWDNHTLMGNIVDRLIEGPKSKGKDTQMQEFFGSTAGGVIDSMTPGSSKDSAKAIEKELAAVHKTFGLEDVSKVMQKHKGAIEPGAAERLVASGKAKNEEEADKMVQEARAEFWAALGRAWDDGGKPVPQQALDLRRPSRESELMPMNLSYSQPGTGQMLLANQSQAPSTSAQAPSEAQSRPGSAQAQSGPGGGVMRMDLKQVRPDGTAVFEMSGFGQGVVAVNQQLVTSNR